MKVEIALTKPQREFVMSESTHPAMVAGLGAGKSEAGIVRTIFLMLENYSQTGDSIDTLITFPTYDLCKLRGMSGVEEVLQRMEFDYKVNKSEFSIEFKPFGKILFRSYDRPERIVAFQVAHSLCDELDTLSKEKAEVVWRKVSERTRQKSYKPNSISCVTTPDQGLNGFVYNKWVEKNQDGYFLIKAPTTSNPYLPDGYIEQIRANYDSQLAEMYINGEFVNLSSNKVYHFFDRDLHSTTRMITPMDNHIHVSIDFNIGGCCATATVVINNVPHIMDEYTSQNTDDFILKTKNRFKGRVITVYPDASGISESTNASASDIAMIKKAGLNVNVPKKNPFVRDRINAVNSLLSHERFKINTAKCPETVKALEQQGYDKHNKPEKFDTHPAIDDWVDSLGYMIHRLFPVVKPQINKGKLSL